MKSLYISQSAIKDFIACNKRYYYRRFFPEESKKTDEMVVGIIVHTVLEKEWKDYSNALKLADELILEYNLSASYIQKITLMVRTFFEFYQDLVNENDLVETKFSVPHFNFIYEGDVSLVGKFDRINLERNTIIDWKTGKLPYPNDIQSIIYYNTYKQLYNRSPTLIYVSLSETKMSTYIPDQLYTDILYNEIIPSMIEAIKSDSYSHTGLFTWACKRCNYKDFCFKELGK